LFNQNGPHSTYGSHILAAAGIQFLAYDIAKEMMGVGPK